METTRDTDTEQGRLKRAKTANGNASIALAQQGSQIYQPFRALGLITAPQPFVVQQRGVENFITVAIGKSFQIYNVRAQHESRVRAIACYRDLTFTAAANTVYMWKRAKLNKVIGKHSTPVDRLYVFAEHLLSVSERRETQPCVVKIWKIPSGELFCELSLPLTFDVSALMHPDTYLNKILIASKQGTMQLWNIRTQKKIYDFKGWGSPILCVEQSPAVDVVGVGLADGRIVLHNLKYDKEVTSFQQAEGPVTALSFRTTDAHPHVASGSSTGHVTLWDLEKRKLHTIVKDAHSGSVLCVHFLKGEPVMLTCGVDNSLKMWIFDQPDGSARLLRSRSGHSAPPSYIRFYDDEFGVILSCAPDHTLRRTSTRQDQQSVEFSQGKNLVKKAKRFGVAVEELKLPVITQFDSASLREKDWDNVVTAHEGSAGAYSWSYQKHVIGHHTLQTTDPTQAPVQSVAMSACGNFAFLGSKGGWVDKYNIQSGLHRGSFHTQEGAGAHNLAVSGIVTDALNQWVITGGLDKTVKFWDFSTHALKHTVSLPAPVHRLLLNRESGLLAVACDDLVVRVYDTDTLKLARIFEGHTSQITDMAFSADGRWLVTSSTDTTVRTWDLPSGQLLDWFLTDKPVVSLAFSREGDFLATAHTGSNGIFLWSNKTYFSKVYLHAPPAEPTRVRMPTLSGPSDEEFEAALAAAQAAQEALKEAQAREAQTQKQVTQLHHSLLTLSGVPKAKWQSLPVLDVVKERNKPKEPPKKPEQAPFFLTMTQDTKPRFILPQEHTPGTSGDAAAAEAADGPSSAPPSESPFSRILSFSGLDTMTEFTRLLREGETNKHYLPAFEHLKALSPSAVEFEFRSLSLQNNFRDLRLTLEMIETLLGTHANFELLQAYLNLFLKIHGDVIVSNPDALLVPAQRVREQQRATWSHLQTLLHSGLCMTRYLSGIQS